MDKSCINVGILGWGTVGTGVSKILTNQNSLIAKNSGIELCLKKIVKRTLPATRQGVDIPMDCLTTDPAEVVDNPDIDIVVELIGGVTTAHSLIRRAIQKVNTSSQQTKPFLQNMVVNCSNSPQNTESVSILKRAQQAVFQSSKHYKRVSPATRSILFTVL